jgi:hypothetical protein
VGKSIATNNANNTNREAEIPTGRIGTEKRKALRHCEGGKALSPRLPGGASASAFPTLVPECELILAGTQAKNSATNPDDLAKNACSDGSGVFGDICKIRGLLFCLIFTFLTPIMQIV